ncbi:hypothetical protein GA0115239_111218 [Streptomyces sp. BpilaLS-43]|nr:hypothetical protein GA0115239_111218 [Streptomyces sp. BpilaLS-43]
MSPTGRTEAGDTGDIASAPKAGCADADRSAVAACFRREHVISRHP